MSVGAVKPLTIWDSVKPEDEGTAPWVGSIGQANKPQHKRATLASSPRMVGELFSSPPPFFSRAEEKDESPPHHSRLSQNTSTYTNIPLMTILRSSAHTWQRRPDRGAWAGGYPLRESSRFSAPGPTHSQHTPLSSLGPVPRTSLRLADTPGRGTSGGFPARQGAISR